MASIYIHPKMLGRWVTLDNPELMVSFFPHASANRVDLFRQCDTIDQFKLAVKQRAVVNATVSGIVVKSPESAEMILLGGGDATVKFVPPLELLSAVVWSVRPGGELVSFEHVGLGPVDRFTFPHTLLTATH